MPYMYRDKANRHYGHKLTLRYSAHGSYHFRYQEIFCVECNLGLENILESELERYIKEYDKHEAKVARGETYMMPDGSLVKRGAVK